MSKSQRSNREPKKQASLTPKEKKIIKKSKKYRAHDESNTCHVGDTVRIRECRPISKSKTWEVVTGEQAA